MNYKSVAIASATLLALGITLLGVMIKSGIVNFKEYDRVVTVKGLSEKVVEADKVIWPITYKVVGNDLPILYDKMEASNGKIFSYLAEYGIEKGDISVAIPIIMDLHADPWREQDNKPRYNITSVITVTSEDVAKVRNAMKDVMELMKRGIAVSSDTYGSSAVSFTYNSLNEIKPEMIEEATSNGREAAEKFAADSGSRLGKIKTATQGQFSISVPDINAPHKKLVRVVTTIQYYLD